MPLSSCWTFRCYLTIAIEVRDPVSGRPYPWIAKYGPVRRAKQAAID